MESVPEHSPHVVLVSGYPPNAVFGGGLILRGLLANRPQESLTVVTSQRVLGDLRLEGERAGLLPVQYIGIKPWRSRVRMARRLLRSANVLKVLTSARRIAGATRRDSVIVAVPWGGEFGSELFAAAYLAHLGTGVPVVVYELDEWGASLGAAAGRTARMLERVFHGRIVRAASTVWAISDPMAEELRRRFSVEVGVLAHAVDMTRCATSTTPRPADEEFRVVYAGSVYNAQAGAIANVARAVCRLGAPFRLLLYTVESAQSLARFGVAGERVSIEPPVRHESVPSVLRAADLLLLPLAFDPDQRDVVATSFPTKTVEYLASRVPILVHAPSYSTISRRAALEGWAAVVSEESDHELDRALLRLRSDDGLRQNLVTCALAAAREKHDLYRVRTAFEASISSAGSQSPTRAAAH